MTASEELLEVAGRAPHPPVSPPRAALRAPLLLALDPSMRATGWLAVHLVTRELVAGGCIETEAAVDPKAWALARQHDGARRAADLFDGLLRVVLGTVPRAIAVECPLGTKVAPRRGDKDNSADALAKLFRGHTAAMCAIRAGAPHVRPISVSSFAAKRAATGSKTPEDAKAAVRYGVRRLWGPSAWDRVLVHLTTDRQREAVYDAGAVALCALEQPLVRALIEDLTREEQRT